MYDPANKVLIKATLIFILLKDSILQPLPINQIRSLSSSEENDLITLNKSFSETLINPSFF